MSDQPTDVAPADFDLDAWIAGVKPTERSVQFTARGDLLAQADDLIRRYELAQATKPEDRGVNDDSPESLIAQLEALEAELNASRSTWYVKALTPEQIDAARKKADAAVARSKRPPDYTTYIIAAALVRVVNADGATLTNVTAGQVKALCKKFGQKVVLDKLMAAIAVAMSQEPSITAPFSRTSSPDHVGQGPSPSSAPPATGTSPTDSSASDDPSGPSTTASSQ